MGDTVKRLTGEPGDVWERASKRLGIPCRCPQRREAWNVAYAY